MTNEPEIITKAPDDIAFATDGINVPTYFVEHIRGTLISRGFIKLNMIENRVDAIEQVLKAVHVVTIVTPIDQVRAWAKYLTIIADQNKWPEDGIATPQSEQITNG